MRKLIYIKLFEAFKSEKLSKTLAYVDNKEMFLNRIKLICDNYDFPYSQLNDDFFDYLPFNKALEKADSIDDEPCDATSISEFNESGIDGEKCESGKIKRKWGTRERVVSCPKCNGTGVKVKRPGNIKMVKFWFTKDGELVGITAVDGINRNISEKMSNDINDYTIGDTIAKRKLKSLPTGTFVKLDYNNYWSGTTTDLICYIINENRRVYGLQNKINGSSPWRHPNWDKINNYSVELNINNVNNIKMLIPNNSVNTDPYNINVGVDISRYGIQLNTRIDVKDLIKNAHFSIIIDLEKLKTSNYERASQISSKRQDRKSGALKLQTDEDIKRENIKRYLDKLSNIDIVSDFKDSDRLVKRLLGNRYILYMLLTDNNFHKINDIIDYYYKFIKNKNINYSEEINRNVKFALNRSSSNLINIKDNLTEVKKSIGEDKLSLINELDSLSLVMWEKISVMKMETIEDLELVYQKLLLFKNLLYSNNYKFSNLNYFIVYLKDQDNSSRIKRELDSYRLEEENLDEIMSNIERFKKIINKL